MKQTWPAISQQFERTNRGCSTVDITRDHGNSFPWTENSLGKISFALASFFNYVFPIVSRLCYVCDWWNVVKFANRTGSSQLRYTHSSAVICPLPYVRTSDEGRAHRFTVLPTARLGYVTTRRMIGWHVNWKQAVVAWPLHLPKGIEENHGKLCWGQSVSRPRFEPCSAARDRRGQSCVESWGDWVTTPDISNKHIPSFVKVEMLAKEETGRSRRRVGFVMMGCACS